MKEYSSQRPFRFWCQITLPLVYDDSLSYYELLCKVVKYINNIIEDVNNVEDNVTELADSYTQLENFVNTYFSTLDISSEIDTKLDEMAEDGTLTNLISPLVESSVPGIVTAWLDENIEPTTPIIDESLTVSGAGADAAIVGNKLIYPISATGITWSPGYYDTNGYHGATSEGDFWLSNWMPCWEGETYEMVGRTNNETAAGIIFRNDLAEELSYMFDFGDLLEPVEVEVPNGATSMRIATTKDGRNESYIKAKSAAVSEITKIRRDVVKRTAGNNVCYVDGQNGSDSNSGSINSPLKSITKAIELGFKNIKATADIYKSIYLEAAEEFKLSVWRKKTAYSPSGDSNEKIILFNGDVLTPSVSSGEVVANYTPVNGTYFWDVFTARTKAPSEQGDFSTVYNCGVILYGAGVITRWYVPVLPENYTGEIGTFTYNAGQIKIKPYPNDVTQISKSKLYVIDAMATACNFVDCGYIELNSVAGIGGYFYGMRFNKCSSVVCNECECYGTLKGSGFSVDDSNISLNNCVSNANSVDGYGFSFYGESELNNCIGCYNGDDGCSSHHQTKCYVNGGEFSENVSGGVTPAFGSECNISNAVMNNNEKGVQILYASNYPHSKRIAVNGCVCKNNSQYDIYNEHNIAVVVNCVYDSIYHDASGSNVVYSV